MKRFVLSVAVAGLLVIVAPVSASAAVTWNPGSFFISPGAEMPGGGSGWNSGMLEFWLPGVNGGGARIQLGEAYWGSGMSWPKFDVRVQGTKQDSGSGNGMVYMRGFYRCESTTTGLVTTSAKPFSSGGINPVAQGVPGSAPPGTVGTISELPALQTSVSGGNCPAGSAVVGLVAEFTYRAEVDASSRIVAQWSWEYRPDWFNTPLVDPRLCEQWFGVGYGPDAVAEIDGELVTPSDVGCPVGGDGGGDGDWDDPWTHFEIACADPPTFDEEWSWTEFNTEFFTEMVPFAGNWVGHYASCLFIPQGPIRTQEIVAVFDEGWMGDISSAVGSLASSVSSWDGACGLAVMDLPGSMGSVSTCQIGEAWPSSFRTAAGWVVSTTGALAAFFAFARFMGWTKGGVRE